MRLSLFRLVCAVALLGAVTARATPTRVLGLGDLGRYVDDDTNVLQYPGLISKYAHFTYIDLGGPAGLQPSLPDSVQGGVNAGAYLKLNSDFQIGLATSDFSPFEQNQFLSMVAAHANANNTGSFNSLIMPSIRRYDLLVGYSIARDMNLGLRLSYGSNSRTFTPDPADKSSDNSVRQQDTNAQRDFRLTLGFSGNSGADLSYDASIDILSYGLTDQKNNLDTFNKGGGLGFGFSGRAHIGLTNFWSIIPQITYRGSFFSLDEFFTVPSFGGGDNNVSKPLDNNERLSHSASIHTLDFGAIAALKASKVATFWIGPGFQMTRSTYSLGHTMDPSTDTNLDLALTQYSLPYVKFAFELAVLDWMKVRGGAEKYVWSSSLSSNSVDNKPAMGETQPVQNRSFSGTGTIDPTTGAINGAAPDFAAYVGLSFFTQNGFGVDFLLNDDLVRNGFSGISMKNSLAVRAAVSYKF